MEIWTDISGRVDCATSHALRTRWMSSVVETVVDLVVGRHRGDGRVTVEQGDHVAREEVQRFRAPEPLRLS